METFNHQISTQWDKILTRIQQGDIKDLKNMKNKVKESTTEVTLNQWMQMLIKVIVQEGNSPAYTVSLIQANKSITFRSRLQVLITFTREEKVAKS